MDKTKCNYTANYVKQLRFDPTAHAVLSTSEHEIKLLINKFYFAAKTTVLVYQKGPCFVDLRIKTRKNKGEKGRVACERLIFSERKLVGRRVVSLCRQQNNFALDL